MQIKHKTVKALPTTTPTPFALYLDAIAPRHQGEAEDAYITRMTAEAVGCRGTWTKNLAEENARRLAAVKTLLPSRPKKGEDREAWTTSTAARIGVHIDDFRRALAALGAIQKAEKDGHVLPHDVVLARPIRQIRQAVVAVVEGRDPTEKVKPKKEPTPEEIVKQARRTWDRVKAAIADLSEAEAVPLLKEIRDWLEDNAPEESTTDPDTVSGSADTDPLDEFEDEEELEAEEPNVSPAPKKRKPGQAVTWTDAMNAAVLQDRPISVIAREIGVSPPSVKKRRESLLARQQAGQAS